VQIAALAESDGRVLVIRSELAVRKTRNGAEGRGFRLAASFSGG
jgi:hypothetical protein